MSVREQPDVERIPATLPHPSVAPERRAEGVGRFAVSTLLGRGGMGEVWAATDPAMGRSIAVKLMSGGDDEMRAKFVREARITGQLEHPNIVPVHELGEMADGRPFFAMKRVEGEDLERRLEADARDWNARGGPAALLQRLGIFVKVCDAIAYAHSRGVIHRDLKPANIMVGAFGEVLVMDWGLAKNVGEAASSSAEIRREALQSANTGQTMDGTIVGTPSFMPPEQAEGRIDELDARSDVYSLGAILYQVVSFALPYDGDNLYELLEEVVAARLVPPSRRAADPRMVPPELEAVVMRAMAADPRDRYPSAAALADDVRRYLEGRALSVVSYSLTGLLSKWIARHRAAAAAMLVGLVACLAVVVVAASKIGQERRVATKAGERAAAERRQRRAANRATVAQLRKRTELALKAVLALRRVGALDRMAPFVAETEAACADVSKRLPDLAEPYYLLGRVHRAVQDPAPALAAQEAALSRDADHVGARYERAILLGEQALRAIEAVVLRARKDAASFRAPSEQEHIEELLKVDPTLTRLRARIRADLDAILRLDREGARLGPGALRYASGLLAEVRGDRARAVALWREAVEADPDLVEAYSALARQASRDNKGREALDWLDRGIARDRGYREFYIGRSTLRGDVSLWHETPQDRREALAAGAFEDLGELKRQWPDYLGAWTAGASLRNRRALQIHGVRTDRSVEEMARAIAEIDQALTLTWPASGRAQLLSWRSLLGVGMAVYLSTLNRETEHVLREAVADARKALTLQPKSIDMRYRLAHATSAVAADAHRRGVDPEAAYERAATSLEALVAEVPEHMATRIGLARTLRRYAMWLMFHGGKDRARELLRRAVEVLTPLQKGSAAARSVADIGIAEIELLRASAVFGGDPRPHVERGMACVARHLARRPRDFNAYELAGSLHSRRAELLGPRGEEDYARALDAFERAVQLGQVRQKHLPPAALNWATLRLRAGSDPVSQLRRGIAGCDAWIKAWPRESAPWFQRGKLRLQWGAWIQLKRAGGGDPAALYQSAIDDLVTAEELGGEALEMLRLRSMARVNLGALANERKRHDEAAELFAAGIRDLKKALARWPKRGSIHVSLGNAYNNRGYMLEQRGLPARPDYEAAIAAWEKAIALEPGRAPRLAKALKYCRDYLAAGGK